MEEVVAQQRAPPPFRLQDCGLFVPNENKGVEINAAGPCNDAPGGSICSPLGARHPSKSSQV